MARNLIKEKEEKEETPVAPEAPIHQEPQVQVITSEQLIINNLDVLMGEIVNLRELVLEMGKQVGVVFPPKK